MLFSTPFCSFSIPTSPQLPPYFKCLGPVIFPHHWQAKEHDQTCPANLLAQFFGICSFVGVKQILLWKDWLKSMIRCYSQWLGTVGWPIWTSVSSFLGLREHHGWVGLHCSAGVEWSAMAAKLEGTVSAGFGGGLVFFFNKIKSINPCRFETK